MSKILIVNDIEIVNKLLKHNLEEEGFSVDTVLTGSEGIAKARETPYDLILLDYRLPDVNGDKVLEAIKSDANRKDVPIYFISAMEKDAMDKIIGETGADGYLDITVDISALVAEIQKLILGG